MTVRQAGKLFGVAEEKLNVKARFVLTIERQRIQADVGAQEHRAPVVFGVDHAHHAQVAAELDMVEDLMKEHDIVIVSLKACQTRQIVPVDLAIIGEGTSRAGAPGALGEIAELGIETSLANLVEP